LEFRFRSLMEVKLVSNESCWLANHGNMYIIHIEWAVPKIFGFEDRLLEVYEVDVWETFKGSKIGLCILSMKC
jgi:hypothetical protein